MNWAEDAAGTKARDDFGRPMYGLKPSTLQTEISSGAKAPRFYCVFGTTKVKIMHLPHIADYCDDSRTVTG